MDARHSQDRHTVRVEWGPSGAESLARHAVDGGGALAVVVDVLSFTTCVSVAADRGTVVHPYRWADDGAADLARRTGSVLAVPRQQAGPDDVSLSPGSLRAARDLTSVVLPSPNGSTISALLDGAGAEVVAASLRNRDAVAAWLLDRLEQARRDGAPDPAVVVVPGGERWPDGSLRPAVEDLWGAGAVVDALVRRLDHRAGPMLLSPEAEVARAAWSVADGRLSEALHACGSGRELVEKGYPDDVAIAAELDASSVVPVLREGAFVPA